VTDPTSASSGDIAPISIEEEMKRSYLDYAMSVIVARALPDVRDGLKPVHRRILYAMNEAGYDWNRPFRKSARVVGDVMGKYHPHGDAAIYDALVRMAQDFSMRLPLIEGQGNFGSMDGDPPAAMRYTEARLHRAAAALLADIDRETVDFQPTYDDQTVEPVVLPAQFPNLLVNGANGIAVGMATNIPPHNLGEIIAACIAFMDDPAITDQRLMEYVPGPDFPTGGIVMGRHGLREAYRGGRGSIVVRGRAAVESIRKDRQAIVISEIPYQVNKLRLIERIAECVQEKLIDGISDLRDESDRDGVRVVVELKRDAAPDIVLNQLYRHTPLQSSFGFNMLALNGGRPELMGLRGILAAFCAFREDVIARRTRFDLRKTRERAHLVIGLALAVVNLDPVIELIRAAPDPVAAKNELMARDWSVGDIGPFIELVDEPGRGIVDGTYRLSDAQARAILELRLQRLTGLERDKLVQELRDLTAQIADLLDILGSRPRVLSIMREELLRIRAEFDTPRRTTLEDSDSDTDIEDLIQQEDMVVTVTNQSYVKRVPLSAYRAQRRGGKGRSGMATREEDFVAHLFVANTHQPVLFFTASGMVHRLKCYQLPVGTPQSRGRPIVQLLPAMPGGEAIAAVMPLPQDEAAWTDLHLMFATSAGNVRRNALSDFLNVRATGKIAMKLEEEGAALDAPRQMHPFSGRRGPALRQPLVHRGARHPPRGRRRGDRHVDAAPCALRHRRTRYLSAARAPPPRHRGARTCRGDPRRGTGGRGTGGRGRAVRRALRRTGRRRAVRALRHREWLRQAQLGLRIPGHRPRWAGLCQHRDVRSQRSRHGLVPGRRRRPDHVGHRWRTGPADQGRRHSHRGSQDPGRASVQGLGRREGGVRVAPRGGQRRARRRRGNARRRVDGGRRWLRAGSRSIPEPSTPSPTAISTSSAAARGWSTG
jgi:DNA gyrase subunit A